jgi:hypothetical protein
VVTNMLGQVLKTLKKQLKKTDCLITAFLQKESETNSRLQFCKARLVLAQ